ncbi:MAG: hypothetical protein JXA03_02095 [Bacteroidales bacterium]|nr:hypothetical protein [Bacteroidales bacterium]
MENHSRNNTFGFGMLIIAAGFAILLHQMEILPAWLDDILISWQMLLIAIGLFNVFYKQSRVAGYILICVGVFFLLPQVFELPPRFGRNFWPLIIIAVGVLILSKYFRRAGNGGAAGISTSGADYIDEFNIFSGSEKKVTVSNFKGGKITCIFGGSEIDLTGSELSEGENVIEIFYLFGGSSLIVPAGWMIHNKVTSILGGFSDKGNMVKPSDGISKQSLVITGTVIFGGGEIKRR